MARAMKDSGIEWLGDIPADWEIFPIKYLCSYNDEVLQESTAPDFDFDYIEIGAVEFGKGIIEKQHVQFSDAPSRARRVVRENDIIVSTVRTYLKAVAQIPQSDTALIASTGFVVIRPRKVNPVFLMYAILSNAIISRIEAHSVGISYPAINASQVVRFKLPIPPLDEQQRIAAFLDGKCARIDSVVEKTRASIEEYRKLKQAIITRAVTKGIRPNRPTKDSGIEWLGDIPADWELSKIKHNFTVYSGATPKSEFAVNWDGNIIWITPADYKTTDRYVSQGKRNISATGYNSCGTTLVPKGSIIFSKRAPIGTVAIAAVELCTNQGCLSCVPNADTDSGYYCYVMSAFTEQFNLYGTGTTFKEISYDVFCAFKVPRPPLDEQQEIADYLDEKTTAIDSLVAKKNRLVSELESLKKSLIFEYVTGKKEVPT